VATEELERRAGLVISPKAEESVAAPASATDDPAETEASGRVPKRARPSL
jgi:hypothetical protein